MQAWKNQKMRLAIAATLAAVSIGGTAGTAHAGGTWQWRGIVRPNGEVAVDFGLGVGLVSDPAPPPPATSGGTVTGLGMNLELSGGLGRNIELGLRTGIRMGRDGRWAQADRFGRAFETETYGQGGDTLANPELRLRGALISGGAAELALEGRAYLPLDSDFGFMLAMPLLLRVGIVRIDTGLYVPIILHDPRLTTFSLPIAVWFQVSSATWLGPMFGLRASRQGNLRWEEYPFGFGLGTMLSHSVDLRGWIWFPDVSRSEPSREFGLGLALEFRF